MAQVFISYARSTQALAEQVERKLLAAGYSVWRDNALPAHRPYADVIEERLTEALAVVVLWSKDAARSEWVRSEANKARELGKLVQASLDRSLPPMPFDQLHCADLEGGVANDGGWVKVLESVAHLIASKAPAMLASEHALPRAGRTGERLLAVLPFENLSGDAEFSYFSDGVADEVLHAVVKTTDLRVIARSSSFQLRGVAKSPVNVAAVLSASHLLDGTVRRSGERVRVSAELVDCATQTLVWSGRFDRNLTDILALQDEIAGAIAAELKAAFAPRERGSVDPVAYDLYLKSREITSLRLGFDAQLLEEVVARDPEFYPAWESLALHYASIGRWTPDVAAVAVCRSQMEVAAEKALALNPRSVETRLAESMMLPFCGAFSQLERLVAEALSFGPKDAFSLVAASAAAAAVGRNRVALAYSRQAYEVDPLSQVTVGWYAAQLATTGAAAESLRLFDEAVARWPNDGFIRITAIGKDLEKLDWEGFERHAHHPGDIGIYSDWRDQIVVAAHDLMNWDADIAARTVERERAILAATRQVRISQLGHMARLGLTDEVYAMVDQADFEPLFQPNGRMLPSENSLSLIFEPAARVLRQDVRFMTLCTRLGYCDYWLRTDRWPDCAEETIPFYDFKAEARALARVREPA